MSEIIKQLLTGKDNQTHDLVRWLGILVVFIALALTIYTVVWRGQAFDPKRSASAWVPSSPASALH